MEQLEFQVKGSSTIPYRLIFIKDGDSLTAICDCLAGQHGSVCKHRVSILDGKTKGIVSDNADDVATVVGWLPGTDVAAALGELRELQALTGADKAAIAMAKKNLARVMNN